MTNYDKIIKSSPTRFAAFLSNVGGLTYEYWLKWLSESYVNDDISWEQFVSHKRCMLEEIMDYLKENDLVLNYEKLARISE